MPTQAVSYIGTFSVECSGRWEGTPTWGWATRILRQSVEGTAVMKVSVGTAALTVPSVSQPRALQGGTAVPTAILQGKTQNSTPGMLLGCSEAVAAVLFLSAGPHSGSSPSCRQDSQGFHGYPCWISQGFQHFGHADPSCLPLNPSFMAERGPLAVHTLRALVAAAPEWGSRGPALPASSTLVWGFNKGFQGGEAFD